MFHFDFPWFLRLKKPLVSVIIASYNHASFVEDAVRSVLNQTMTNIEVIVVDDASTDATADIVATIQDPRLRLIRLTENRKYNPRNIGLQKARGTYIAFQNSDDVWAPQKLEEQISIMNAQPETVLCFTDVEIIDEASAPLDTSFAHGAFTTENRSSAEWLTFFYDHGNALCISSALVRKSALKISGIFTPGVLQLSDLDLWVRLAAIGNIFIIDKKLTFMRVIGNSNLSAPHPARIARGAREHNDIRKRYTLPPISAKLPELFGALRSSIIANPQSDRAKTLENTRSWLTPLLRSAGVQAQHIPLEQSKEWHLKDGKITHASGRFFSIIGIRFQRPGHNGFIEQPLIDQREIGTLGYLIRSSKGGPEILVHAKIEPGNRRIIQLAPTSQATHSNTEKVHGGELPPFSEYFIARSEKDEVSSNILYDMRQSEQGTRFYRKRNRNVLVLHDIPDEAVPQSHKWMHTESLLDLAQEDFLLNTDARSVLVCSPWGSLIGREPFSRYADGFGHELYISAKSPVHTNNISQLKQRLLIARQNVPDPEIVPLDQLTSWSLETATPHTLSGAEQLFAVKHIAVHISGREVAVWDQPIIESDGEGKVILFCARIGGILHFLFTEGAEPGLINRIELTASIVIEPGAQHIDDPRILAGELRAQNKQSEEGGRFWHEVNLFQVIDLGILDSKAVNNTHPEEHWLTVAEIRELLNEEGWFTNEARSALSLLLIWL